MAACFVPGMIVGNLKLRWKRRLFKPSQVCLKPGKSNCFLLQALRYEISLNPDIERCAYGEALLAKATVDIKMNDEIDLYAQGLERLGIKTMDALHLSSAIHGKSDFFCSSDLRFLKKARQAETYLTKVVTPLGLIEIL